MSHLPYVVIVTSSNCSACLALHSSGSFDRSGSFDGNPAKLGIQGFKWDANSFWKLLVASNSPTLDMRPRLRVFEYEVEKMDNISPSGVKSFTEFTLRVGNGVGSIHRDTFVRTGKDSTVKLIDDGEDPIKLNDSFTQLVKSNFPVLANYAVQFPLFVFFGPLEWKKSIVLNNKGTPYSPYGRAYTLTTGTRGDGSWGVVARDNSREEYMRSFISYTNYVISTDGYLVSPELASPDTQPATSAVKGKKTGTVHLAKEQSPVAQSPKEDCSYQPLVKIVSLSSRNPFRHPVRR